MRLALTSLLVDDYDMAIDFFVGSLGFELVEDRADVSSHTGAAKRWVVVRPKGAATGMVLAKASTPQQVARVGSQTGERVGFFLETDDFARDHEAFAARGVRFLEAPRHEAYGTVAVFEDIAGNRWDLIEYRSK